MSLATFTVTNPIGIFTCQIASGQESEACEELFRASNKKVKYFYDALSDFDLIGIVPNLETDADELSNMILDLHSFRDIQLISCFSIYNQSDLFTSITNSKLMTITMINVSIIPQMVSTTKEQDINNSNLGSVYGFEKELKIVDLITSTLKKNVSTFEFWVMGTLGMPSLILIQTGFNIETLLQNLVKLSDIDCNEIHFFHTITCLQRVRINKSEWKPISKNEIEGNVLWRIGISYFGTGLSRLERKLAENSDLIINTSFGKRDITIQPSSEKKEIHTLFYISSLLKKISEIESGAIETKTILSLMFDDTTTENIRERVGDAQKDEKDFLNWALKAKALHDKERSNKWVELGMGWKLIDTIQRFQMIYFSPGFVDLIYDMKDYLKWICDQIEEITSHFPNEDGSFITFPDELRGFYESMDRNIRVFNYALDKRLAGVELGIGNKVVTSVSGLGNYRTLLAIKAVGQGLFQVSGAKWKGFTILDYWPAILCLPGGIINMSGPCANLLGMWSKLAHETGHAYTIQNLLMSKATFINTLTEKLKEMDMGVMNVRSDKNEVIEELLANIFEYYYAYGMDYVAYRDTTWANVDRDLSIDGNSGYLSEQLLRTLAVLIIHLQMNQVIGKSDLLENMIGESRNLKNIYAYNDIAEGIKIRQWGKVKSIQGLIQSEIINPLQSGVCTWLHDDLSRIDLSIIEKIYLEIDPFRNSFIELFNSLRKQPIKKLERDRIKDYKKLFTSHKICKIRVDHPSDVFTFILALHEIDKERKQQNQKSYVQFSPSEQITATLSLWDYYCSTL